jgi:hypothetical protein
MHNPWGSKEWTGDYSKENKAWKNKTVKTEIYSKDLDNFTLFWINLTDYLKFFGCSVINFYMPKYETAWMEDFHLSSMFEFGAVSFTIE